MSTIVTRAGKGSALTHNEVDANFVNLNTDKIEAAQTVTLTNKTLSTGTAITAGTINGATIGATTPSSGAFTTLSSTGNTTLGDAAADTVTVNGTVQPGVVISGSSSGDALRITQTGAGNAFVVEDTASPDSTPFVIDTTGKTLVGLTAARTTGVGSAVMQIAGGTAPLSFIREADSSTAINLEFAKARASGAILASGDTIGRLYFSGSDGTAQIPAAYIDAAVDGTPGTNDMPGRLVFSTTADGASSPTERMRIDSSGNLGLGVTPSAWPGQSASYYVAQLGRTAVYDAGGSSGRMSHNGYVDSVGTNRYIANGFATRYDQTSGTHSWSTAPSGTAGASITFTQAMTLHASGGLSVGSTSDPAVAGRIICESVRPTNGNVISVFTPVGTTETRIESYTGANTGILTILTGGTERARFTSGGFFKVSTTGAYVNSAVYHEFTNNQNDWIIWNRNTAASPSGLRVNYSGAAPNGVGNEFLFCNDTSATRAAIRSNGGLANFSANNVNLSDRREKTNFAPAKNYLDAICAIPVQTFNYIDQSEDDPGLTLGVVAQDVQAVAPEMVMESNWGTEENPKMRLSIYQTDLQYALMKSIQELKSIVDAQAAEIAALRGNA